MPSNALTKRLVNLSTNHTNHQISQHVVFVFASVLTKRLCKEDFDVHDVVDVAFLVQPPNISIWCTKKRSDVHETTNPSPGQYNPHHTKTGSPWALT